MIEQHLPKVPYRQVELADGFPDPSRRRMIVHQSQRRFETESRGEQPAHHDVVHARGDAITVLRQAQSHLRRAAFPAGRRAANWPYAQIGHGFADGHAERNRDRLGTSVLTGRV
jgi:hypothetical protein